MLDPRTELLFWLTIMRDHTLFQLSALSPKEVEAIETVRYYNDFFQSMMEKVGQGGNIDSLSPQILQGVLCFIEFKKALVKGLLTCDLEINFPPTFINHMINEALEFVSFLTLPPPPSEPFNQAMALADLHRIWLADAAGHAAALAADLDGVESLLVDKALKFKETFEKLLLKANELQQMLSRTGLSNGALEYLSQEAVEWLEKFITYLEKLARLRYHCMAMAKGTDIPLIQDHMIREEKYYIGKIQDYIAGIKLG